MRARGWQLGGETSGHLVCLALTTTGDGIVSALQVLVAMVESGRSLAELRNGMRKLPQAMVNVQIENPGGIAANPLVDDAIRGIEAHLNGRGRVVIRPSGTEPVVRVMVEGEDADEVNEQAASLAAVVEQANGA